MGNFTVFIIAVCVLFSECLIEVKKPLQKSCSTSDPKKDCDMYSTANDPQQQMIPRQQMIPKMDRK